MADVDRKLELEESFSQTAVQLFTSGGVPETLQQVVDLAAATIEGCDGAGVFVVKDGQVVTAAASAPLVVVLDELQITSAEGPCLDASKQGSTFYAQDLVGDDRWPVFAPAAVEVGIRCVLAYSLSSERLSALNLYARLPAAFGATDRAQGLLFATLARLAVESAEERAADDLRAVNLTAALRTRELIGQAQGILMERERITADQAFDVLGRASRHMNVKLREVAQRLVETGQRPDTGTSEQPR